MTAFAARAEVGRFLIVCERRSTCAYRTSVYERSFDGERELLFEIDSPSPDEACGSFLRALRSARADAFETTETTT